MVAPISPALKTSARSAYRALFRASGTTFAGDDRVLYAFRDKVRAETVAGRQEFDPAEYEARVQHAFEVATVLKKNVVQGSKESEDSWHLRITPETELGSNDNVKRPYSRPTRGAPRLKCGEDPTAVAPLPPKSLRSSLSAGAGSTRLYSTSALGEEETEAQSYGKARIQSLVAKLSQVNRRVAASPTRQGQEPSVERVLLEDKIAALVARIDYLASEVRAQTHEDVPPQKIMDAFLDVVWLLPEDLQGTKARVEPPLQMRQFVRYLYAAGRIAAAARGAARSLDPALRMAIGKEMETPAPGSKNPGVLTPADELRAIIWRVLMVKRGMQRVSAGGGTEVDVGALANTVNRTLSLLTFAQGCLEDLEKNGPKEEDARSILGEMERVIEGSAMLEMKREIELKMEQGNIWDVVDRGQERHKTIKVSKDGAEEIVLSRIRQPFRYLQKLEEEAAIPPQLGTTEHAMWRRRQLARYRKVIENVRNKMWQMTNTLNSLIAVCTLQHKYPHRAKYLHEAKDAFTPSITHHLKEVTRSRRKQTRQASATDWARILHEIRDETKEAESKLRYVDNMLRNFVRSQAAEEFEANKEARRLLVDLRMDLMLAFDPIWRLNRRLKKDIAAMFDIARSVERSTVSKGRPTSRIFGTLLEEQDTLAPA